MSDQDDGNGVTMGYESLHDREEIEEFLRRETPLHLYELGDLDDFFWPYSIWYGWRERGDLKAVMLLYIGQQLPVLLALCCEREPMLKLLTAVHRWLPVRFFAHLSPDIERFFEQTHRLAAHGTHFKMILGDRSQLVVPESVNLAALSPQEVNEVHAFYQESFPQTWFDPRMLESGQYYGWRENGKLVSVGGIHVYSPRYRVAALGNITTHPDFRGRGFATAVTARVCQSVCSEADHVGLNVKADNGQALACYRRLDLSLSRNTGNLWWKPGRSGTNDLSDEIDGL